jgi:purine-binding chemotaxis protein CheW
MSKQYVIFQLDNEFFGVEISLVLEIINPQEIFKVPNTPKYIEGLINLRGKVFTLFNLKEKLNLYSKNTGIEEIKILLISLDSMNFGFIVDTVNQIALISDESINTSPDCISQYDSNYFTGLAEVEGKKTYLLNVDSIINNFECSICESKN